MSNESIWAEEDNDPQGMLASPAGDDDFYFMLAYGSVLSDRVEYHEIYLLPSEISLLPLRERLKATFKIAGYAVLAKTLTLASRCEG